jgi:hypothetical protein
MTLREQLEKATRNKRRKRIKDKDHILTRKQRKEWREKLRSGFPP